MAKCRQCGYLICDHAPRKTHPDFLILDEAAVIEAGKNPTVAASLGIDFVENQPKVVAVIGEPKAEKGKAEEPADV